MSLFFPFSELKHDYHNRELVIPSSIMNQFDCYNYGGAKGATSLAARADLTRSSLVIDVGSGIGGPARYYKTTINISQNSFIIYFSVDV